MRKILFAASVAWLLSMSNAFAENIFIGSPACGAPPGCPVYGSEVNGITGNTVTLDQATGNSSNVLANPVLLLIGVANDNGTFNAPTVTLSDGTGSLGGVAPAGMAWNSSTGFAGTMTSGGPITDAYQALGLTDPFSGSGNSETFANWSAADSAALGISATSFGVYVYQLYNTGLIGHPSTVNVTFGSSLPVGTFMVSYACDSSVPCSGGNVYATPFTQSAVAMEESPAILTLGADLIALAGLTVLFRRRQKSRTTR